MLEPKGYRSQFYHHCDKLLDTVQFKTGKCVWAHGIGSVTSMGDWVSESRAAHIMVAPTRNGPATAKNQDKDEPQRAAPSDLFLQAGPALHCSITS